MNIKDIAYGLATASYDIASNWENERVPSLVSGDPQDGRDREAEDADQERRAIFLDEQFPLKMLEIWDQCDVSFDFANLPELVDIEYQYWLSDRLEQERSDPGSKPGTRYFEPITNAEWRAIHHDKDGPLAETDKIRMWLRIAAYALRQAEL